MDVAYKEHMLSLLALLPCSPISIQYDTKMRHPQYTDVGFARMSDAERGIIRYTCCPTRSTLLYAQKTSKEQSRPSQNPDDPDKRVTHSTLCKMTDRLFYPEMQSEVAQATQWIE